jgi:ribosomal protein L12E/L44/L45/RPP1/RPP2|tara:strand:- start:42 stop:290 length:249 start_codon:yes stop_codon:yes gene_type:complete
MLHLLKSIVVKSSAIVINRTSSAKNKITNSVSNLVEDVRAEVDLQKAKAEISELNPEDLEPILLKDSEGRQVYAYKDFVEKS